MMADTPQLETRRTDELRIGRISARDAGYFVTLVTALRGSHFNDPASRAKALVWIDKFADDEAGTVKAAVVMPDHVHVLMELKGPLTIGRWVARLKSAIKRDFGESFRWQRDFWERRVRPHEGWEDYGLYLFLNPYRAGLISVNQIWDGWRCFEPDRFRFVENLRDHCPPAQWVDEFEQRFKGSTFGE